MTDDLREFARHLFGTGDADTAPPERDDTQDDEVRTFVAALFKTDD